MNIDCSFGNNASFMQNIDNTAWKVVASRNDEKIQVI